MSSFGFDAPEDVSDTSRPDPDALPVPPEDPADLDESQSEGVDTGADTGVGDDEDPPEHPFIPSPS